MPRMTASPVGGKDDIPWLLRFPGRPEPGDGSPQAAVSISAVTEYLLPATVRGVAVQAAVTVGVLTRLWIALSPAFITLQHGGGGNAAVANLIGGPAGDASGFGVEQGGDGRVAA